MKYTKPVFVFMLLPGLFLLAACSGGRIPETEGNSIKPVSVSVANPSGSAPGGVTASGLVEAVQTAAISTRLMGTITRIYVKVGDRVNRGQVLVSIGSADLQAKKAQAGAAISGAQAELESARKDFDRVTQLYNRQSATAGELDNATLRYNAAQSKLEAAQQMRNEADAAIGYTRLTAPFAGTVTQKMADEGSMANPGIPLLMIEQNDRLQVSAAVAESDISRIGPGDKARVEIKSTGNTTEGTITQLSPSSALTGAQYIVKIGLPAGAQKGLYAGMYANVFVPVKNTGVATAGYDAVLVPVSALLRNDQLTGLYTVSSGHTALLRWVRTGRQYGDKIEILSGLGKEETFIVSAGGKLYNGVPVQIK